MGIEELNLVSIELKKGDFVYVKGEIARNIYLLIEGEISLEAPKLFHLTAGPDNIIGLYEVLAGKNYLSNAICTSNVTAVIIPGNRVLEYARKDSSFLAKIFSNLFQLLSKFRFLMAKPPEENENLRYEMALFNAFMYYAKRRDKKNALKIFDVYSANFPSGTYSVDMIDFINKAFVSGEIKPQLPSVEVEAYQKAINMYLIEKDPLEARIYLKAFVDSFPKSKWLPNVYMILSKIARENQDKFEEIRALKMLIYEAPSSELAPQALFELGTRLYTEGEYMGEKMLMQLIFTFPQTSYAERARKLMGV